MKKKQVRKKYGRCTVTLGIQLNIDEQPRHRRIETVYSAEEVEKNFNKSQEWWAEKALSDYLLKKGLFLSSVTVMETSVVKE